MNVLPMAAYRWAQRSSLHLGLRVGGSLLLADIQSSDPCELSQRLCNKC